MFFPPPPFWEPNNALFDLVTSLVARLRKPAYLADSQSPLKVRSPLHSSYVLAHI